MIRIFKVAVLLLFSFFISCKKDDAPAVIPPVAHAVQYPVDLAAIDKFLDEYYMEVSAGDDVTFTKIPTPNVDNKVSIRLQTTYPLQTATVNANSIDYKLYYLKFKPGTQEQPTRVDSVFVSYKGRLLNNTTFDQAQSPIWFPLDNVIRGWKEIMPLFKTGDHTTGTDGAVTYTNYGAGVMFLPSAFGYYNNAAGTIPSYSPLIFSFKLNKLNYTDQDYDRIDSKYEDLNGNGNFEDDDTDGDGKFNYLDTDDDGDGFTTKAEIKRPDIIVNGVTVGNGYYPYNGAANDDLSTPNIDERQGIPRSFTGPVDPVTHLPTSVPADFTDPTRLRRHLDKTSKPPYQ